MIASPPALVCRVDTVGIKVLVSGVGAVSVEWLGVLMTDSLAYSSYVLRVSGSSRRVRAHAAFSTLRHVSPLVGWTLGMGIDGFMCWVKGFWYRLR